MHRPRNNYKTPFFKPWRYKLSLSPFWLVDFSLYDRSCCGSDGSLAIQPWPHCYRCGWSIQQPYARDSAFAIVYGCFSRIKKMLGRTEMRTRDRMISRGDRARIATCSLRTSTDRLKANYSIDNNLRRSIKKEYHIFIKHACIESE